MTEADVIASLECALDENGLPDAASQEAVKLLRANAARIRELEEALNRIRELNMTAEDEDGHRWANSDLIEQEIVAALSTREEGKT